MRVRNFLMVGLLLVSEICHAQFKNIKLAEEVAGMPPAGEPDITINQRDPKNIVASVAPDRLVYTQDGGETWIESKPSNSYGFYGSPILISDVKGDIYWFHSSDPNGKGTADEGWLDRIVSQKSTSGGVKWEQGVSVGRNAAKNQLSPSAAVNLRKQYVYLTWTQFDEYAKPDTACHSNVMFSLSTNAGKKWTDPIRINQHPGDCLDNDGTATGAMPAVAADGKIFVVWSNQGYIFMDRSYDEGKMWLQNDLPIAEQSGGWSTEIPGLSHSNGMPVLMIDNSTSRFHGSLYVLWADQRNGKNDTDIWLMRSTNRGDNWTLPQRINKDAGGKHQFLPGMTVDQATGNIYVVYYDRRNHDDLQTDVYLAYSSDGGNAFNEVKISENPFVPTASKSLGNHIGVAAYKGTIAVVWTRMDNEKSSVWTAILKEGGLIKK